MTNREVATALFLSPRTVEHHLGSVLRRRGLRSLTELARHLAQKDGAQEVSFVRPDLAAPLQPPAPIGTPKSWRTRSSTVGQLQRLSASIATIKQSRDIDR